jgi:hypothetical protein
MLSVHALQTTIHTGFPSIQLKDYGIDALKGDFNSCFRKIISCITDFTKDILQNNFVS